MIINKKPPNDKCHKMAQCRNRGLILFSIIMCSFSLSQYFSIGNGYLKRKYSYVDILQKVHESLG